MDVNPHFCAGPNRVYAGYRPKCLTLCAGLAATLHRLAQAVSWLTYGPRHCLICFAALVRQTGSSSTVFPMQLKSSVPPSSSKAPFRLMLVEDNDGFRGTVHRFATAKGFACSSYANPVLAISDIGDFRPDVILTDFQLPNMDGLQLLQAVHASDPALPVVLMSGKGNFELAIDALRAGAFDLLAKPFESLELAMLQVSRAAQHRRLGEHNRALEAELARHQPFGELVGESPAMLNVYRFIETVAPTNCPVLIFGESGTGKRARRSFYSRTV